MRFGFQLGMDDVEVVDGYDPMMYARAVKTEHEITMLKRSTALNQAAIEQSIASWQRGMTWREFNHVYHCAAVNLGGFVRDPRSIPLPVFRISRICHCQYRRRGRCRCR